MEVKSVNIEELVNEALANLDRRSAKIVAGRYGTSGSESKTLAELGQSYSLTRERVRQIESHALDLIKKRLEKDPDLEYIAGFIDGYLEQLGDVRRHDLLTKDIYSLLSLSGPVGRFSNNLRLLADIIDSPELAEGNDEWHDTWYRDDKAYKTAREIAESLISSKSNDFYTFLDSASDKYHIGEPIVINYLSISKHFMVGPYGDLGPDHWLHINPKTVRDKSYLVLMKAGQPLHFKEVAERVNSLSDNNVHHQTVHNELIKDPRFVLVRRGTYGLKDRLKS